MPAYIYRQMDFPLPRHDPPLESKRLAISISDLPELLRLAPDRAQPHGARAKRGLFVANAHAHDVVFAPPVPALEPQRRAIC
jgi:hypothetical protein